MKRMIRWPNKQRLKIIEEADKVDQLKEEPKDKFIDPVPVAKSNLAASIHHLKKTTTPAKIKASKKVKTS